MTTQLKQLGCVAALTLLSACASMTTPPALEQQALRERIQLEVASLDDAAALADLDLLLTRSPGLDDMRAVRAEVEAWLGKDAESSQDFRKARAGAEPIGMCIYQTNVAADPRTTFSDCDAALRRTSPSVAMRLYTAVAAHRLHDDPRADADLAAAVADAEGVGAKLLGVCATLGDAGFRLDEALRTCRGALQLHPNNAVYNGALALVLLRQGANAEALEAYHVALRMQPHIPFNLYGRSIAEARLGLQLQSARDRRAATEQRPNVIAHYALMGVIQ